jgi:hypothetical protein
MHGLDSIVLCKMTEQRYSTLTDCGPRLLSSIVIAVLRELPHYLRARAHTHGAEITERQRLTLTLYHFFHPILSHLGDLSSSNSTSQT